MAFRDTLIQSVSTVALTEYGTSARNTMWVLADPQLGHILKTEVHPPDLLEKELAGAGGAFVTGLYSLDFPVFVQVVHQKRFPARADDHSIGIIFAEYLSDRPLYRLGFGNGRQPDKIDEFSSSDCDRDLTHLGNLFKRIEQGLSGITLMCDGRGVNYLYPVRFPAQADHTKRGGPQTNAQRFHEQYSL